MSNVNYREVKRKAAVGERIKIVNVFGGFGYGKGDVLTVKHSREENDVYVEHVVVQTSDTRTANVLTEEYVVLEPVAELIAEPAAPSPLQSDPPYAAFRQFVADNAAGIRAILPQLETQGISVGGTEGPSLTIADSGAVVARTPKLTRAQVIAKARADVAELERIGRVTITDLSEESPLRGKYYAVEFHVNRDKRAVTALVYIGRNIKRTPDAKFTAKCSPADVFHADLGKAIALRRALGLSVPTEYTDAPQPEKAEVGAVVEYDGCRVLVRPSYAGSRYHYHSTGDCAVGSVVACRGKILDDTDVDYSAVQAEGVAA